MTEEKLDFKNIREAINEKAEALEQIVTYVNNELNEWHRRRAWKVRLVREDVVLKVLDGLAEKLQKLFNECKQMQFYFPPWLQEELKELLEALKP